MNTTAPARLPRRALLAGAAGLALAPQHQARAAQDWGLFDVTGSAQSLRFAMTRARDGRAVTERDYAGHPALLYFGYTFCPDVCPLTLSNLGHVLDRMGKAAAGVRVLFVTVDPDRDTLPVLTRYCAAFGPAFDGLRGTPDALLRLARRYRVAYSVTPESAGHPYEVTHSAVIYAFDGTGAARLLVPSLASETADIAGTAAALVKLV